MKDIQLNLNVEEINKVLTALGNLPFYQVHELISKIQMQAEPQLKGNGSRKSNFVSEKQEANSSNK